MAGGINRGRLQDSTLTRPRVVLIVSAFGLWVDKGPWEATGVAADHAEEAVRVVREPWIGVSTGKLVATDMWEQLGIHWHEYRGGKHAGLLSSARVFDDAERRIVTRQMDETYRPFKQRVRAARGDRLSKEVEDLAGGRI